MGWKIGGFESRQGLGIFLFITASRPTLGPTQRPIQWVPGVISLGVKRPGREADHSPPSSAEVKNSCNYTSTSQHAFMAWCSVKAQGQFYVYFKRKRSDSPKLFFFFFFFFFFLISVSCVYRQPSDMYKYDDHQDLIPSPFTRLPVRSPVDISVALSVL
jgi:hypothetical protein